MGVLATPSFALQPAAEQVVGAGNYINFQLANTWLRQYLPDTYEKEFERYGNRSVASFLRLVGAEMPSASDLITWNEHGRLHTKYVNCASGAAVSSNTATWTINDSNVTYVAIRVGQTVLINETATGLSNRAVVTAVPVNNQITVAYYESGGQAMAINTTCSIFVYGSEFQKGTSGMTGSLESEPNVFNNRPIILKDRYQVNGSDIAQIGWVEVSTENGANGYLWYLKSEHETRLRFEDYLETAMLEAVPMANTTNATSTGLQGTEGVFHVVTNRGNVFGGAPTTIADWDNIVVRLDRQGAIEENVLFVNRDLSFNIDDMLATINGFAGSNAANAASFGLFDNDVNMALNLGFSGFRRGYDFYKSDWKYLNDVTFRGGYGTGTGAGFVNTIQGMLVPAGSTTVYDQVMGKNAKRPFLHIRYRASESEDRRYKTWITGSAGGAATSDLDAMQVNFLSERCACVLGANNFFIFRQGPIS